MIKLTVGLFALTMFCFGCEKDEVAEVEVHAADLTDDAGTAKQDETSEVKTEE